MKKHARDVLLIALIMLIGGVIALCLLLTRKTGAFVEVRVDGSVVSVYPLDEDAEYLIEGAHGGSNRLIIRNGEAWVESASCPDGLCMNMGHIRYKGASIVCLPNRVVISIAGEADEDVDAVVGQ